MAPLGTILAAAATANLTARGFSYHDNKVRVAGAAVQGRDFTVEGFAISDGQDPGHRNGVGGVLRFDADRTMMIEAGRHKTRGVADWWNSRVPPGANTFGHTADELNFAFVGSLVLDDLRHGRSAVTVPEVGFAQGSNSNGNNWWFGGPHCRPAGPADLSRPADHTVLCPGTDAQNQAVEVAFRRGGDNNEINEVGVMGIYRPDW